MAMTGARAATPRRGRPKSADLAPRVLEAVLGLLAEGGWEAVSMDRIAAHSGVAKATLYARWPSKAALVVDAISTGVGARIPPAPDTGDVGEDLRLLLVALIRVVDGPFGRVIAAVVGEAVHDPVVAEVFQRLFVGPRRARVHEVIERGVARGQLTADVDVELLGDVGAAIVFQRLLLIGGPLPSDLPGRIVAQFIGGHGLAAAVTPG